MIVFVCEGRVSAYIPTSFVLLYIFFYIIYILLSVYISHRYIATLHLLPQPYTQPYTLFLVLNSLLYSIFSIRYIKGV